MGYANLAPKESAFMFRPVHTDDIASAVSSALQNGPKGRFVLSGSQQVTLRGILDVIESSQGRTVGAPMIPRFDYWWDFVYGTSADLNMSRLVEFLEDKPALSRFLENTWHEPPSKTICEFFAGDPYQGGELNFPAEMKAYRQYHTD